MATPELSAFEVSLIQSTLPLTAKVEYRQEPTFKNLDVIDAEGNVFKISVTETVLPMVSRAVESVFAGIATPDENSDVRVSVVFQSAKLEEGEFRLSAKLEVHQPEGKRILIEQSHFSYRHEQKFATATALVGRAVASQFVVSLLESEDLAKWLEWDPAP